MATLLHDLMDRYGDDSEKVVALVRAMGANAVEHLLPSLADEEGVYRTMAAQLLAMLGDRRAVAPLAAGLGASGLRTARALREYRERRRAYKDGPPSWGCLYHSDQLGRAIDQLVLPLLREAHEREAAEVRRHFAFALGKLGDVAAVPPLRALRNDPYPEVRRSAALALALLGEAPPAALPLG